MSAQKSGASDQRRPIPVVAIGRRQSRVEKPIADSREKRRNPQYRPAISVILIEYL